MMLFDKILQYKEIKMDENSIDDTQPEGLFFKSGGELDMIRWVYDDTTETGSYQAKDVTSMASQYLMEPVTLADDVRLVDIFKLFHQDEVLSSVFRRDWAKEYLEESLKPATPYTGEYTADGIEYLELYQYWEKDSKTNEITCSHRLSFHGIGFVLHNDIDQHGHIMYKKGSRINWGLMGSHLVDLLLLPLKFNSEVTVCESNTDSDKYGQVLEKLVMTKPTLGQIIHGVLWELSFHGGPAETQAFTETLKKSIDEVDSAIADNDFSKFIELDLNKL